MSCEVRARGIQFYVDEAEEGNFGHRTGRRLRIAHRKADLRHYNRLADRNGEMAASLFCPCS